MKKTLIVDLGNTAAKFAVFDGNDCIGNTRVLIKHKEFKNTRKILAEFLENLHISAEDFDGGMLFSVVPSMNKFFLANVRKVFKLKLEIFNINKLHKLPNGCPKEIGADLLADVIGGIYDIGAPVLVADLGTVTKFMFVESENSLAGCAFIPGMDNSLKTMSSSAELLPTLLIKKPAQVIGVNTIQCMQSGVYYSTVSVIEYYFDYFKKIHPNAKLVLCGGYASHVYEDLPDAIYDPLFIFKGMKKLFDLTR